MFKYEEEEITGRTKTQHSRVSTCQSVCENRVLRLTEDVFADGKGGF